jgi:hypothetical protein
MKKFCHFHRQAGEHNTLECELGKEIKTTVERRRQALMTLPPQEDPKRSKQERWRATHADAYRASRRVYMQTYRAKKSVGG